MIGNSKAQTIVKADSMRKEVCSVAVVVAPMLALMLLTRPLGEEWFAVVPRLRRKEHGAAGSFTQAMEPVRDAWRDRENRWSRLSGMTRNQCGLMVSASSEDPRVWAADLVFVTIGCTHRRCYCGILGKWYAMPGPEVDIWALLAAHGTACAIAYTHGAGLFYRHFSPRFSHPHTLLLSLFSTSTPFEMLWLYSSLHSVGPGLQRTMGRAGFLALYLSCAAIVTLVAAANRHSMASAAGMLAVVTYHTLMAPNARCSILGFEMGAKAALAVQFGICAWPAISGGTARPSLLLILNALPVFLAVVT